MCDTCDWEDALDLIDETIELIEDLPSAADEFAESVEEKLNGIDESITATSHVTEKQFEAIRNMHGGVKKWLRLE